MTKRKIIGLSISLVLIALIIVMFSVVFCLRKQTVTIDGNNPISISKKEIISTADLKNGKSIFMLDKVQATQNIETKYPYVKVVQIKTTSLTEINIKVRARYDMFYVDVDGIYYVLDEDLKVLRIEKTEEPTNLVKISDNLKIDEKTKEGCFVGSKLQKKSILNLYKAMVTVVTKTEGETETYLNREDVSLFIKDIKFENYNTFNKMIITTSYGVKLDIENPTKDLQNKINISFSTIKTFLSNPEPTVQEQAESGIIKLYYDLSNKLHCVYLKD